MAEELDVDAATNEVAKGIANIRQTLAPIEEAARGYRAELEKNGWSPTVAEQMAFQFHAYLMVQFMNGVQST